jgi:ankyrin repeat protein
VGARVNARSHSQATPLHIAAATVHQRSVEILLQHGSLIDAVDEEGKTPLHWATSKGSLEVMAALIDRGAGISHKDDTGPTCLHHAAMRKRSDWVKFLLENGRVDVDCVSTEGETPLHYACKGGCVESGRFLLARSANLGGPPRPHRRRTWPCSWASTPTSTPWAAPPTPTRSSSPPSTTP